MSTLAMPSKPWRELVKRKREKATFRIVMTVRGKQVVKLYDDETEFRRWLSIYELQMARQRDGAIESIRNEVVYR